MGINLRRREEGGEKKEKEGVGRERGGGGERDRERERERGRGRERKGGRVEACLRQTVLKQETEELSVPLNSMCARQLPNIRHHEQY